MAGPSGGPSTSPEQAARLRAAAAARAQRATPSAPRTGLTNEPVGATIFPSMRRGAPPPASGRAAPPSTGFAETNPPLPPTASESSNDGPNAGNMQNARIDTSYGPQMPARRAGGNGNGGGARGGSAATEDLNAAALRMAQGGEPRNDIERAIQARMQQLTAAGPDPNMRAYKKGGIVKKAAGGPIPAPKNGKAPPPFQKMPVATNLKPARKTPPKSPGIAGSRAAMPKQIGTPPPAFKKGGKVVKKAAPEGSAEDMKEDKKFAKKAGTSMERWEKSPTDKRHDAGKKVFRKGGSVKRGKC